MVELHVILGCRKSVLDDVVKILGEYHVDRRIREYKERVKYDT